jgi:para-nitrobenzyl esterase
LRSAWSTAPRRNRSAPAQSADIPFLVGNTFHEFSPGTNNPQAHLLDWAGLAKALQPRIGAPTDAVIAEYRRVFPRAKPLEILGLAGADLFRRGAVLQAERKAAQGAAPAYLYWFGWKTPVLDGRPLAFHCQDLAFWFDNIDLCAQATGGGAEARALATRMSDALVAFARTGNPSHPGLPAWPPYSAAKPANMILDEKIEVRMDPDRGARRMMVG